MSKTLLGRAIRDRRKLLRITQPHLAELAGISVNTLYKIERGSGNPTLNILEDIGRIIGMQVYMEVKTPQP